MDHVLQDAAQPATRLKPVLARAAIVAAILGTALTTLNQPGAVFGQAGIQWLPLILVYLTPFMVVSVSQIIGARKAQVALAVMTEFREGFAKALFSHGIPARAVSLAVAVGGINTTIVAADILLAGGSLDQLPVGLILQALTLPTVFGALSQALSFRRTIRLTARPTFATV